MIDLDPADQQLSLYGVLTAPADRDLQALVDLAAMVCDVPTAAINLISSDSQHQIATAGGIDPSVCSRDDSMCAAVIEDRRVVVVEDARVDPRFETNPFVTGIIGKVRFYASAPLTTPGGVTIGRLCVFDDVPHELSARRAEVLTVLAARIVDVLELRLRTRELEAIKDELHRSNESLSLFAGQVSHDLLQPLTAVLANAELLTFEPSVAEDPEATKLAQATLAAGDRMARLIDTILAYARAGGRLEVVEVPLDRLINDLRADLSVTLAQRDAEIRAVELPVVRADRQQLHAILQNLISNAIKFTPAHTRPIVRITATLDDGAWRIAVTDNGAGIPPERREAVFDLYSRGDLTVGGTGIGLATVRRAVEAHGGDVGIEDAPDGGTTVWFSLPR
ncbi:MAG: sensor histidine kinase [Marmoricola sp.]